MTLRNSISNFIQENCPKASMEVVEEISRVTIGYVLYVTTADRFKAVLRSHIGPDSHDAIYSLKRYLDTSNYTVSRFWRAVFAWCRGTKMSAAAIKFNVDKGDLKYAKDVLSKRQRSAIVTKARHTQYIEHPDNALMENIIKEVKKYCAFLVRKKLYFILKSDHGTDYDGLLTDLLIAAISVVHGYDDQIADEKKMLSYAKKAAHNYAIRLIEYHTAQKRRRLYNDGQGFSTTTLSLDMTESEEETFNLYNLIPATAAPSEDYDEWENMNKRVSELDPSTQQVVQTVLDMEDEQNGFDQWLKQNHDTSRDSIRPQQLFQRACEFHKVSMAFVQDSVKQVGLYAAA
jgi:hypothetical protein